MELRNTKAWRLDLVEICDRISSVNLDGEILGILDGICVTLLPGNKCDT